MPADAPRLLLATTSLDKVREYRQIFSDLLVALVLPADLGLDLEVDESGATFRENARLKAEAFFQAAGDLPCLAEDSGFEVDALGGAPGVQSARWEGTDYERKNRLIIERLAGLRGQARRCRYVCEIAFMVPGGGLHYAHGELVGSVADRPLGSGGFGYDPIFYMPELGRTLAQLTPKEKHALSHRGRAGRGIRPVIERTLQG
jgi:XTP/dITP diphosphohydrolase